MAESSARTRMENLLVSLHQCTGPSPARHYQQVPDGSDSFLSGLHWAALKSASSVWTSCSPVFQKGHSRAALSCDVGHTPHWVVIRAFGRVKKCQVLCKSVTRASEAFEFIDFYSCSHVPSNPSHAALSHPFPSILWWHVTICPWLFTDKKVAFQGTLKGGGSVLCRVLSLCTTWWHTCIAHCRLKAREIHMQVLSKVVPLNLFCIMNVPV